MDDKKKMKALRDRINEERESKKARSAAHFQKLREKAKQKEINTFKSAKYQIVRYFIFIILHRSKTQQRLESGQRRQSSSLQSFLQSSSIRSTQPQSEDDEEQV